MKKILVIENEPVEVLASSIRAISAGIKNLRKGPLGENALLLLISNNCTAAKGKYRRSVKFKVSPATIKIVLDSIESLQATYLRKQPEPQNLP